MKDSLKIYFQEVEKKLLPMEVIFEILEWNHFHWLEWRIRFKITFPQDEKKTGGNVWYLNKSLVEMSEK